MKVVCVCVCVWTSISKPGRCIQIAIPNMSCMKSQNALWFRKIGLLDGIPTILLLSSSFCSFCCSFSHLLFSACTEIELSCARLLKQMTTSSRQAKAMHGAHSTTQLQIAHTILLSSDCFCYSNWSCGVSVCVEFDF